MELCSITLYLHVLILLSPTSIPVEISKLFKVGRIGPRPRESTNRRLHDIHTLGDSPINGLMSGVKLSGPLNRCVNSRLCALGTRDKNVLK